MNKKKTNKKIARSAITGQFVSLQYAKLHPSTTVVEKKK